MLNMKELLPSRNIAWRYYSSSVAIMFPSIISISPLNRSCRLNQLNQKHHMNGISISSRCISSFSTCSKCLKGVNGMRNLKSLNSVNGLNGLNSVNALYGVNSLHSNQSSFHKFSLHACHSHGYAKKSSGFNQKVMGKRNKEHLNRLILAMERYLSKQEYDKVDQVWQRILELEYVQINTNAVNILMKTRIHQNRFEDVEALWNIYFVDANLRPSLRTYNIRMYAFAQQGNLEMVEQIMETMEDEGIQPNEISYTNLINALRNSGNVEKALEKYDEIFVSHPKEIGTAIRSQHSNNTNDINDKSDSNNSNDTHNSSDSKKKVKMIPLATTTKLLLEMRGDDALPLVRLWAKNREISTLLVNYYSDQGRLEEAIESFGEYFECSYFGKQSKSTRHVPTISVYDSLLNCIFKTYEARMSQKNITDEELDNILNIGYDLYNSFMECGPLEMTTQIANKFIFLFVELQRTEEAFFQIYRRYFVPSKSVNRRTLIHINMPTLSATRGKMLSPTLETYALLLQGAENENREDLIQILKQEGKSILKDLSVLEKESANS